ncbi:MAG TPA: recombinase family protein [Nostoc sp.]|uniref:recombinase family protein n=1 Tax=Nostoc sp. TaxID=1180 RepID=UPI002D69701B|nr:recombinase family protein [Nostoc sp.]HYX16688.1 recombinase family protein [Nostoc sp.]
MRQSSPHQVLTNQESLKMQYALKQKAVDLGWPEANIEIIDRDLGITASSTEGREGFKDLVTKVTLGQVGIVLSYEVTRLARNCSDWYPLLDICGMRGCLIGDRDGVYDPSTANGRLLLGLKGQISELELHTLKGRLTAGIISKAQRGELGLVLPVGLVRDKHGLVSKEANVEVQRRIELIFETFLKVRSANKTMRNFNDNALTIPRRNHFGDIVWKKPSVAAIISTLKNPAYAGMFVYGRSRAVPSGQSIRNNSQKQLPIEQWRIKVENKYPQYIDRETFDKIQAMLKDNHAEYDRNKTRGVPRTGKALLHGIVYCGECGHKLVVQYKAGTRYLCNYLRQQYGTRVCQHIPADPIDDYVVVAFFEALSPVEIDMYQAAMDAKQRDEGKLERAKQQQLERLRYQARFAERQFNQADPDNRLVAAELERRWESALLELKQAEDKAEQEVNLLSVPQIITQKMKKSFDNTGQKMPEIWKQNLLSQQQRKALLRCLIDKVVIHRIGRDRVRTRIVWKGGDTTTADIPITVGSLAELSNAAEMENAIIKMATAGKSDLEIADTLTKQGFRSPLRKTVLESTVKIIRLNHRIMVKRSQSHPRTIAGYLTVPQIASSIGVTKYWVYDRIHNGKISVKKDKATGLYLFPNKASTIKQFMALKNGNFNKLRY